MPFSFFLLVHWLVPTLMTLSFDFAAPTRRFAVLFFTSNVLVNKHSDLLALGFLTRYDVIGNCGLLSMNPSGVYSTT